MLLFATALCALTAMLSGVAPAVAAERIAPASALRANRTLGPGRRTGPSSVLLIAQVAVSLVLLIGAGLFVASLRNLRTQDLGLAREHELLVWTVPGQTGRQDDAMVDLWRRIQERHRHDPRGRGGGREQPGRHEWRRPTAWMSPAVIMTIEGESPKSTTRERGPIVCHAGFLPRRRNPNRWRDAISPSATGRVQIRRNHQRFDGAVLFRLAGRRRWAPVHFPGPVKQAHQIVGVIQDYVRTTPRNPSSYFSTYFPYRHQEAINRGQQSRLRVMLVAIRTIGDPLALAEAVRGEIRAIDPLLPILRINTTEQQLEDVLAQDRLVASLSTALGAIAMFLASLGLFGVLSYRVARRTNEIGVRLAFGATRARVLRMILVESGRLVAAGLVVGVIAALLLARLVAARLYGVSPTDPSTIAGAVVLLSIVAGVAALIPARRAAIVDPAIALRCD